MFYTFYSFKGGVGRSMALANIAELLYRRGLKVLMMDFDLEAPGLERFFWDDVPKTVTEHRGVIDLAESFKALRTLPPTSNPANPSVLTKFNYRVEPLSNFIVTIHNEGNDGGALHLIPAGYRPKNDYVQFSERVRTFDWDDFYLNWNGGEFFDWFRAEANTLADVILVDSRTGITEIGGICTHHLADVVVTLVTTNQQNLEGSLLIAESLKKRKAKLKESNDRQLEQLIVPGRIELSESPSLEEFKNLFNQKVAPFKPQKLNFAKTQFDDLCIPYVPRYSYFERLAAREPDQPVTAPLISAFERLITAMVELASKHTRFYRSYYGQTGKFSVLGPQARVLESPERLVGRQWVFDSLDSWLVESSPRVFLIIGDPGAGKTTLAKNLVQISQGEKESTGFKQIGPGLLAYAHFCQPADIRTLDPLNFVKSLALVLANRYPQFAAALAQIREPSIEIEIQQSIGSGLPGGSVQGIHIAGIEVGFDEPEQRISESKNRGEITSARQEIGHRVRRAYANLLLDPLNKMCSEGFSEPIIILIDQIEAALAYDPRDNLVSLGALALRQLPQQVRFIFLSRRDPSVLAAFRDATILDLATDSPSNLADIMRYALERLNGFEEDQQRQVADQVVRVSAGNFLFARLLLDEFISGAIKLDKIDTSFLPRGIEDLYQEYLHREIGSDRKRWEEQDSIPLGVLCVAFGDGLMSTQLSGILGKPVTEVNKILQPWMRYLKGSFPDGPFRPYHASFRNFLLSNSEYPIRHAEAHQAIADYFLKEYNGEWGRCSDQYSLRYTAKHLLKALEMTTLPSTRQGLEIKLNTLLTDADFLRAKANRSGFGLEDLAEDLSAAPPSASILNNLGLAYYYLGDIKRAIDTYLKALELARRSGDRIIEGLHHGNLGVAYATLGDLDHAIEHNLKALAIAREVGDRRSEGNALGNLGLAYANSGEPRRAIEQYEEALAIAREVDDRRGESIFLGNLGAAYHAMGELPRAIDYYEKDLVITREIGDRRGEINALSDLGLACADLGEPTRAIEYCQNALAIAREIGDRGGEGNALGNLGLAYADLGETRRAVEYYTQALEIIRELVDPRLEGKFLSKLGSAYHSLGDLSQAIEYYKTALDIAQKIGDRRREGNALRNLGLAYADKGDPDRAREMYQQSKEIFEKILGEDHPNVATLEFRTSGGDAIGRGATIIAQQSLGKTEIDNLLQPLVESLNKLPPASRKNALRQVEELKNELAKGPMSNDTKIAKLVDTLLSLEPGAVGAFYRIVKSPIVSAIIGPVTRFVVEKIRERGEKQVSADDD